jgi:anti-sigma regulatory factor (Ser/Thr protein kinase)
MFAKRIRPAVDIEIKLEPTERAPREARAFVSRHLTELGYPTLVEDGSLIVSELVTNSLKAAEGKPLWVDIRRAGSLLPLEVWDCSPEPPVHKSPDFLAEGGRGLYVVDELSITWGCDTFFCGKVIWVLLG